MTRQVPTLFAAETADTTVNLDGDFAALAPGSVLPCTATGTNAIALTPVGGTLSVSAYSDKEQYTFVAPATTTGAGTVSVSSVGFLKLFKAGGTVQVGSGDVVSGQFYQIAFQSALDPGAGGFVIVSAIAVAAVTGSSGKLLQTSIAVFSGFAQGTTLFTNLSSIPTNTFGDQYMSLGPFTASQSSSVLVVTIQAVLATNQVSGVAAALFNSGTVNAIASTAWLSNSNFWPTTSYVQAKIIPAGTGTYNFAVRASAFQAGTTMSFNANGSGQSIFSGTVVSSISVFEYLPF